MSVLNISQWSNHSSTYGQGARQRYAPVEGHPVNEAYNNISDDILYPLRKAHLAGESSADLHSGEHARSPSRLSALCSMCA